LTGALFAHRRETGWIMLSRIERLCLERGMKMTGPLRHQRFPSAGLAAANSGRKEVAAVPPSHVLDYWARGVTVLPRLPP